MHLRQHPSIPHDGHGLPQQHKKVHAQVYVAASGLVTRFDLLSILAELMESPLPADGPLHVQKQHLPHSDQVRLYHRLSSF